ncbi:lantibiotic dehydratase [Pedobacter jeongneungensis]|uniref:Lantibiotic dehydratase n=1 Tax=Pedobacter jeongneungensis TaxID=947309 RepID=A0ABP8BFU2_9SPHI
MSLQIFPYSLVRYAGLHHQLFDQLKLKDLASLLIIYNKITNEKEQLKNSLCDALYPVIKLQKDDKVRQQIINIKRHIFNNKRINFDHVYLLPEELQKDLSIYLKKLSELTDLLNNHALKFDQEQILQRKWLQEISQLPELQNGLLLSSPLLYEQLSSFIKKDSSSFKQKEHRAAFSLARYLSRMAFKTSPFSSFTYTGLMNLDTACSLQELQATHQVSSRLKLNNAIFEYLKAILKKHPLLNEHLLLKLNITAEIKEDKICFLSNFNNVESFQQINANGLQLMVYQYLNENQYPVSLKKLISDLIYHFKEPDHESIKKYLLKLVEAGMLAMELGFSGMDQKWDHKLLLFLKSLTGVESSAIPLITLFENLEKHRLDYQLANSAVRYRLLQEAEQELNNTFATLQQEAGLPFYTSVSERKGDQESQETATFSVIKFVPYYFPARNIFYEDCFTTENLMLPESKIKDFVTKTNQLINHLLPLDVMRKERNKMRDFFLKHYQNNESVALTAFYKDYYFYVKKPEKENELSQEPDFSTLKHWKEAVLVKLKQINHADKNFIRFDNHFFSDLPNDQDLYKNSTAGMFVQFADDENGFSGVINALLPGMGKVSGRFLSLFDQKVTESFVQHNEKLYPDKIKVELNDASTFNANIHPPLLTNELELPGGNNIYPPAKQFNIRGLTVRYDSEKDILTLHKEHLELYSYDLSLESFYNRSNLYQLLAHFNPDARVSLQPFIQLVDQFYLDKQPEPAPDLFVLPRIVYADNVVVRRKTWRIKTATVPNKEQLETDFEYLIRLNNWLIDNKIPGQVFLFLRKRAYQVKSDEKREGLHDDYKPQYLSFDNPLLIALFKKLLLRAGHYITLEEVFPKPDEHVVREYLIQWYNN